MQQPYEAVVVDAEILRDDGGRVARERWQRGGLEIAELGTDVAAAIDALQAAARRTVVATGSPARVRDALATGCGLVTGVATGPTAAASLEQAGAATMVPDIGALRFPRRIPPAEAGRPAIEALRAGRPLTVFLDFDGTLSAIVDDPAAATITDTMRDAVLALAARATVAVVSGRDLVDVRARSRLNALPHAGSHGLDIAGPTVTMVHPEAAAAIPLVDAAETLLRSRLASVTGAVVERKRFSVAAHYRMVAAEQATEVTQAAADALAAANALSATHGLRDRAGKMVVELLPDVDWDKGRAVLWLQEALGIDGDASLVLYVGDDETDEDAFRALAGHGLGIHVGAEIGDTLADYRLAGPPAVEGFLNWFSGA